MGWEWGRLLGWDGGTGTWVGAEGPVGMGAREVYYEIRVTLSEGHPRCNERGEEQDRSIGPFSVS